MKAYFFCYKHIFCLWKLCFYKHIFCLWKLCFCLMKLQCLWKLCLALGLNWHRGNNPVWLLVLPDIEETTLSILRSQPSQSILTFISIVCTHNQSELSLWNLNLHAHKWPNMGRIENNEYHTYFCSIFSHIMFRIVVCFGFAYFRMFSIYCMFSV